MSIGAPNRIPWPPLIFAIAALVALSLGWMLPLAHGAPWIVRAAGGSVILLAIGLDASAVWTMHKARANILPHRAATALVTWGPFRLSRNPIYLGNTLALLGAAGLLANPWFIPAAACGAVASPRPPWSRASGSSSRATRPRPTPSTCRA
jgi:protein-S-isoprenylcysteine O-methyltransferase Ste14